MGRVYKLKKGIVWSQAITEGMVWKILSSDSGLVFREVRQII